MLDRPTPADILSIVAQFLRERIVPTLPDRLAFETRVAANALDLALRQIEQGVAAESAEHARLAALLGQDGAGSELNDRFCELLRTNGLSVLDPAVSDHLLRTALDKLAIDQPGYAAARRVQADLPKYRKERP